MKLAIGSDHAGFKLKWRLENWLRTDAGGGHQILDLGTGSEDSCDYPDFAQEVAKAVAQKRVPRGILICGTGIGMAIAANKTRGVRAAVVWNAETAALASEHNGANVICLGARFTGFSKARLLIAAFLKTPFGGGRHARRLRKIRLMDRC